MAALLFIPARLVPRVTGSLLTLYSVKAEAVHHAIVNEAADGALDPVRRYRAELLELDELLDQLDFSPERRPASISGEREVIAAAVFDALGDATDTFGRACGAYQHGRADIDQLAATSRDLRGLVALLREIEINATRLHRSGA